MKMLRILLPLPLFAGTLLAQGPRMFVSAGISGRHYTREFFNPRDVSFDGVAARIGLEWIGKRFGWTASLGGDFAGARNGGLLNTPQIGGTNGFTVSPKPLPVTVPSAIYRANAGLVVTSDDRRTVVLSLGPALFTGRATLGRDLVWGGLGMLTVNPFGQRASASRVGLGLEASVLPTPLGRGVDWMMTPTVRITM